MASQHLFFCCEDNCDAEAHVSGGRCDGCFEAHITYLRELHNPTRCDYCHERINCGIDSDALYCENAAFCSKWCHAGWLNKHDCDGFHYDEEVGAYTCDECRPYYPEHKCSGELDYERGCYVCDDRDDPRCPQSRSSTRERILREIRNTETMLSWNYDYDREVLEQSLASLREQLSQLAPACEKCGEDYSVALASNPTICPSCAFERLHPCEGRRNSVVSPRPQKKCCEDCGTQRPEIEPVIHCEWWCAPCWKARFGQ